MYWYGNLGFGPILVREVAKCKFFYLMWPFCHTSLLQDNCILYLFLISCSFFKSFWCLRCNEGLYVFNWSFADFCLQYFVLIPVYLLLLKNNSSALVGFINTLLPDGIFHWQPTLVLLGLVAPVTTADSIRNNIPTSALQPSVQ